MNKVLDRKNTDAATFQDTTTLREIRHELRDFLGDEVFRSVHVQRPWLDVLMVGLTLVAYVGNYFLFALFDLNIFLTIVMILFQGWLITIMGLLSHDVIVHRNKWRGRVENIVGALLFMPATVPCTKYRLGHLRHHSHIGTEEDSEVYKQDIKTRWQRILFTTVLGFKMATSGKWSKESRHSYGGMIGANEVELERTKIESLSILIMVSAVFLLSAVYSWKIFVFGWLMPLMVVAPALNTLRIIIEHAHVDPSNKYWLATPYRTGFFAKFFFLADSGDCHILHHIFPRVPWYGMPKLVRSAEPFFEAKGVVYKGSFVMLLKGWFVDNYPHRSKWLV
jgi:fatty acid desaturase